jgi:hypothetical protein
VQKTIFEGEFKPNFELKISKCPISFLNEVIASIYIEPISEITQVFGMIIREKKFLPNFSNRLS